MEGYQSYECTKCGGTLEFSENGLRAKCKYCGTDYFFKENKSQALVFALNRARGYLQNNDFDRAINEYETISKEYPKDAEAAWGLAISKYGIVYAKDDKTGEMVPTCSRIIKDSILDSAPYKIAIENCADEQRPIYEKEAQKIDGIQKRIKRAMDKEADFDVFISFKAEDENGNATEDSVIARRIYDELTSRGIKTFFSAVTLDGRVGDEYEPIIYRALFSCKHFILVTTNEAYIEAPWVKNEWTRFRDRAEEEKLSGVCTAVFKNMKPYALPQVFQSQGVSLEKHFADYHLLVADNIENKVGRNYKKPIMIATLAALLVAAFTIGTLFLLGVFDAEHEHTMSSWVVDTEATCTKVGERHIECSECGVVIEREFIEKTAHTQGEWKVDSNPTCKTEGERHLECAECGAVIERAFIEKAAHIPGEWIIDTEANCRDEGAKHKECTACGTNVENAKIEKTNDHTVVIDPAVEPTDKSDGLTEGSHCSFCGKVLVAQTVISANLKGLDIHSSVLSISGETMYGSVSNVTTTFSFANNITAAKGATYVVATDVQCQQIINSKTVNLEIGDNIFYIYVENEGEEKFYTVTIRRLPTYTVSFNANGGSDVNNQTIEEGSCAFSPVTTLPGYSYTWDYDFSKPIMGDITINAIWTANTDTSYTVEYYLQNVEDDGYTILDSETENLVGTTDTTASAEIKTFEHFTYSESASTASGNINGDGSLVLKVCYTRNTYTVSTDVNNSKGGSVIGAGINKYDKNVTITATTNPGYTFLGWFEGETKVFDNISFTFAVTKNVTYTAKWKANDNTAYTVEYYFENVEDDGYTVLDSETENLTGTTDTTASAEIKTFEHFTYNESASTVSGNINGDGSQVLKVYYSRDTYTVSLDKNVATAGNVSGGGTYKYGKEISLTMTATTNQGYTFLGWTLGGTTVSEEETYTVSFTVTENVSYIANWEVSNNIPYKVEYYLENVEDDGYTILDSETENLVGTTDTTANAQIKTFEHFTYNESASIVSGNINGDGSQVLKVYYTRNTYTVSSNEEILGAGTYKYGTEVTAKARLGYNVTWKRGDNVISTESTYTFIIENDVVATASIKDEMKSFNFTSTYTSCEITGLKDKTVTEVVVPDCVTSIGDSAFSGCDNLTSVTIPDSVTLIGEEAFYGCNNLTSITVDEGNTAYKDIDGNLYTKDGKTLIQYAIGKSDTSFTIPNSVTSIGSYAFSGCYSLSSVTIPDSVTSIGSRAFYGCDSLTSVTIGNSVTTIGSDAFAWCDSLTSVTIPDSVTTIGSSAFRDCDSLSSVTIGNGVTSIGYQAFYYCNSLTSITVDEGNAAYKDIDGNLYTKDCKTLIQYAIGKTDTTFTIPDSVTTIGNSAFWNCNSLTNVTIGNGVTTIDDYAFVYCSSLTSVTIPDSVTSIGFSAFSGCTGLTSVTIGNGVTSIGSNAFYYCTSLTSVTIGNSVTTIGDFAFAYCTGLTGVTIPDSVTSIGSNAFYKCTGLTSVTIPDSVTSIGVRAFEYCNSLTSVNFVNPNGWKAGSTSLSSTDLSNTSTAAKYLSDTYDTYKWTRS